MSAARPTCGDHGPQSEQSVLSPYAVARVSGVVSLSPRRESIGLCDFARCIGTVTRMFSCGQAAAEPDIGSLFQSPHSV
jgi:hypothetical protein